MYFMRPPARRPPQFNRPYLSSPGLVSHKACAIESLPEALWIEDQSYLYKHGLGLKRSGVRSLVDYYSHHPQELDGIVERTRIVRANAAAAALFGCSSPGELTGSLARLLCTRSYREYLLAGLEDGHAFQLPPPSYFRAADGRELRLWRIRQHTADGTLPQVHRLFSLFDLSALKEREEDREARRRLHSLQIRELNHRIKNNLNVISSLLRMQSTACTSVEDCRRILENCCSRLRSVAIIHELLDSTLSSEHINMGSYIRTILQHLMELHNPSGRIRLHISVEEEINFSYRLAIPCGLIITELITNALKYAFPDDSSGLLSIGLHRHRKSGECELIVADNGVGLPDTFSPALSDSFGTQLIVNLSKQLGGRAEFGSLQENGGTRWNIRFPFDPHTPDKRSRIDTKSALL